MIEFSRKNMPNNGIVNVSFNKTEIRILKIHMNKEGSLDYYFTTIKVLNSFKVLIKLNFDNAIVETFFRSLEAELIYRTTKDLRKQIDDYIVFYNVVRPHNKLKGKTPEQFDNNYCKTVVILASGK